MFAEDLSAFFSQAEFAVTATLDGVAVSGIFDEAYIGVDSGASLAVDSTSPTFLLTTAAAGAVHHGSTLVVDVRTFTVISVEPDGTGLTLLRLQL